MRKTDCDIDADGNSGNTNDDGGVNRNGAFDTKGADETDNGDEQTESVARDLIEYN